MPIRAKYLIALLLALAAGIIAAAVSGGEPQSLEIVKLAVGLGCFAVVAEVLVYKMPQGGRGSIALVPFMALTLVTPTWLAIVVVGVCEALGHLLRRRELIRVAFNTAQAVIAIAAASATYRVLGGVPFTEPQTFGHMLTSNALPALACLAAVAAVNSVAVSSIIALTQNEKFVSVWKANTLGTISFYLLAWPLACLLAYVYAQVSVIAALALAIPMIGVRQLYKTTIQLQQNSRELLELMVKAIEARDPYTSGHSRRVAKSATIVAKGLGLSAAQIERVGIAALLHDIGKIHEDFAPILRKESSLTREEWEIMKTHSEKGAELVATLSDLRDLVAPIRHHHENWNGTGYPDGIAGEMIPLASRIITFADTIDALTTDRPYRKAFGAEEVRAELVRCRGTQFDPRICDVVLSQAIWNQLFPTNTPTRLTVVKGASPGMLRQA